jgi:hypothetical protein
MHSQLIAFAGTGFGWSIDANSKSKSLKQKGIVKRQHYIGRKVSREDYVLFVAHNYQIRRFRCRRIPEGCNEFDKQQFGLSDSDHGTSFIVCGLRFSFLFLK